MTEHIALTANGHSREADVEPRRLLVPWLREDVGRRAIEAALARIG